MLLKISMTLTFITDKVTLQENLIEVIIHVIIIPTGFYRYKYVSLYP